MGRKSAAERFRTRLSEVVFEEDTFGRYTVFVNSEPSSCIDVNNPLYLGFEYMQTFAARIADWVAQNGSPQTFRALHLGGGACSMANYLVAKYRGSQHLIVDIDEELLHLCREQFGLPRAPALKLRGGDGFEALKTLRDGSFDIIIRDAFDGGEVPASLQSAAFYTETRRVLREGGLYIENAITFRNGKPRNLVRAGGAPGVGV